jgi:hypothetical protein
MLLPDATYPGKNLQLNLPLLPLQVMMMALFSSNDPLT